MTGSFGGVIRDILANKLPALFHKEIYATACIAGGTVYFLINGLMNHNLVVFITIMVVISVRLLSLKYHWVRGIHYYRDRKSLAIWAIAYYSYNSGYDDR